MSKSFKLGEGGRNVSRARTKKKLSPQHHQLYQQYKHMSGPVPFKSAVERPVELDDPVDTCEGPLGAKSNTASHFLFTHYLQTQSAFTRRIRCLAGSGGLGRMQD